MKSDLNDFFNMGQNIKEFFGTKVGKLFVCLSLSLIYTICSKIVIPLPFNFVPLAINELPLYFSVSIFGWTAVSAYFLFLAQGYCGFFDFFLGGATRLLGPTGGYLLGFAVALIFLTLTRKFRFRHPSLLFFQLVAAQLIVYAFGLLRLSWFVPASKLLVVGLFPFIPGALIKLFIVATLVNRYDKKLLFLQKD